MLFVCLFNLHAVSQTVSLSLPFISFYYANENHTWKKSVDFFLLWFFVIFCCNFIMRREKRETEIAIIPSIWFTKCGVPSVNRYKMHVLNIQLYTVSYIHWLLMTFNETQMLRMLRKKHEFNLKCRKKNHLHMLWKGFGTAVTLCLSHCWKLKPSTSAHAFQSTIYMTILQNNEMKPDKWNKRKIALVCVCVRFHSEKFFLPEKKNKSDNFFKKSEKLNVACPGNRFVFTLFSFFIFFCFETPNRLEKRKKTHVKYDQYQCMINQVVTKFCNPGISLDW